MSGNPLSSAQQAQILLTTGVEVSSASSPALDGTYRLDYMPMLGLQAEINALLLSGGATFADGGTSLNWPDKDGTTHAFTPAQFHDFAVAISNFAAECSLFASGVTQTAPASTATIP